MVLAILFHRELSKTLSEDSVRAAHDKVVSRDLVTRLIIVDSDRF
jgi:hypothetical protein